MSKSLLKWVNRVSIYRPRSSGHLTSSKRSSGGSSPRNLEFSNKMSISHKIWQFRMSSNNFARLCEIKNASAPILPSWSISHDCAKFLHGHAKSAFRFPFEPQQKLPSGPFRMSVRKFHMIMRNEIETNFLHFQNYENSFVFGMNSLVFAWTCTMVMGH